MPGNSVVFEISDHLPYILHSEDTKTRKNFFQIVDILPEKINFDKN